MYSVHLSTIRRCWNILCSLATWRHADSHISTRIRQGGRSGWQAAPWAKHNRYPFLEPYSDFVGAFILEAPTNDFLRDYHGYITAV